MDQLIFWGYEAAASWLPLTAVMLCLKKKRRGQVPAPGRAGTGWLILFTVYVLEVLHVTGIGTLYDLIRYSLVSTADVNLTPFLDGITVTGILNILLFVPLGILAPLMFTGQNTWWRTALSGAAFSLAVELSQLLNSRRTDMEDLILNTLGTLLGYGAYRLVRSCSAGRFEPEKRNEWELAVYLGTMFLGRFFLFDEFGLAKLLYHIG